MLTNNTERAQAGWGFWLWWMLASIVGLAVGVAVADAVSGTVGFAVSFAVSGDVAGASIGTAQSLVLRRQVSQTGWWVLASSVGLAVGFAVALAVLAAVGLAGGSHFSGGAGALVLFGAVAGASVGIAQWLVLRRHIPGAGWWVLASIVGTGAGVAVISTVIGGGEDAVGFAAGGAVGGALYGAITGGVLVWLLRQPVTEEPSPPQDAV